MKVSGYGEMLAKAKDKELLAFEMFGSYQGEWLGFLDAGNAIEVWKGYYGSCSGCDFIQNYYNWDSDETYDIPEKDVNDYFKEKKPFIEIKKEDFKDISMEDFEAILPANIKTELNDSWDDIRVSDIYDLLVSATK